MPDSTQRNVVLGLPTLECKRKVIDVAMERKIVTVRVNLSGPSSSWVIPLPEARFKRFFYP